MTSAQHAASVRRFTEGAALLMQQLPPEVADELEMKTRQARVADILATEARRDSGQVTRHEYYEPNRSVMA